MATFRIALLGPPHIIGPDGPVVVRGPQARALLWYLAAAPNTAFSRGHLAEVLWADTDERSGRASLSAILFRLRRLLPAWPLTAEGDTLAWNAAAGAETDVALFQGLNTSPNASDWEKAVSLWRGPFLDGFNVIPSEPYDEWLQTERQRWEYTILDTLAKLATAQEKLSAWERLALTARRALAIDPLQERFHRLLMSALALIGDRAAALSHYDACRQLLRDQLGVEPDEATAALREAILLGQEAFKAETATARLLNQFPGGAPEPPSEASPPIRGVPPFVGRQAELDLITAALGLDQNGGNAFLYGDTGIGKSRLVEEVVQWAKSRGEITVLTAYCYRETEQMALAPIMGALDHWRPGHDWHGLGRGAAGLIGGLTRYLRDLPRPILLAMDDVHWADASTLQLLALLARGNGGPRLSLLITGRAGDVPRATLHLCRQLEREKRLVWIELGALSYPAIEMIAAGLTGQQAPSLAARLYARTQGNPLFAVELLRSLAEEYGHQTSEMVDILPVPTSITTVIEGRLLRLTPAAQDLIGAVAVFPGKAPFAVLHQVTGHDESAVIAALDQALAAGILREDSGNFTTEISFTHDLIRQVILDGMSKTRRAAWHRRVLTVIAAAAGLSPEPESKDDRNASLLLLDQLVYHARAGGLWERALAWSMVGAQTAERAFLMPDKARFLGHALDCLHRLAHTPERRRQISLLQLELAHAFLLIRLPPVGTPGLKTAGVLIETGHQAARRLAEEALPNIRRTGDRARLAAALRALGMALGRLGEFVRALEALAEAVPLDEALGQYLDAAISQMSMAIIHALVGTFGEADTLSHRLLTAYRRRADPVALATILALHAVQEAIKGRWDRAKSAHLEAAQLNRGTGLLRLDYMIRLVQGPVLAAEGDLAAALSAQETAAALAEEHDTGVWVGFIHYWLGKIRLMAGEVQGAKTAAETGLNLAAASGDRHDAALCRRLLGETSAAAGDQAAALPILTAALAEFKAMGAAPEIARTMAVLARLPGPDQQSYRTQALTLFRSLGMGWDLAQKIQD